MENLSQSPADTGADDSPFQNVCFVCFFLFQVLILLNHLIHQAFCFFIHFFIHLIVWKAKHRIEAHFQVYGVNFGN